MTECQPATEYAYFVNYVKYVVGRPAISGREVRAAIPDWHPEFGLSLEMRGATPDLPFAEDAEIELGPARGPRLFFVVPPPVPVRVKTPAAVQYERLREDHARRAQAETAYMDAVRAHVDACRRPPADAPVERPGRSD